MARFFGQLRWLLGFCANACCTSSGISLIVPIKESTLTTNIFHFMETKKSPKADLEKKSSVFFLVGLAVSMLLILVVFQYKKEKTVITYNTPAVDVNVGPDIPVTVRAREKAPDVEKSKAIINPELPPLEVPNEKLVWDEVLQGSDDPNEDLIDVPLDPYFEGKDAIETVPFVLIEKMARPFECESFSNKDEQKRCLNAWIQAYLGENTNYPELARQMRLEDKVYVTFIISEHGDVEKVWVEKGKYDVLNEEALRVVEAMPDFIPGAQREKPVKMKMTIPVNFRLSSH